MDDKLKLNGDQFFTNVFLVTLDSDNFYFLAEIHAINLYYFLLNGFIAFAETQINIDKNFKHLSFGDSDIQKLH